MIELPKYTVPTYDPRGLAENERKDFTRRIYGANAEEKVGVLNLYVKPKRKGFID